MSNADDRWDNISVSTCFYILMGACALPLGVLGWLAEHFQWFAGKDGLFNLIFSFIFGLFDWKCLALFGVCAVLTLLGVIIDLAWASHCSDSDPDSTWWITFIILIAFACTLLIVPSLNKQIMLWEYGHEMGLLSDYRGEDDALVCSIRNLLMYGMSFVFVLVTMRQWVRVVLLELPLAARIVLGALLLPLDIAGALAMSYCLSRLFAVCIVAYLVYKLLCLVEKGVEAKLTIDEFRMITRDPDSRD